MPKDRNYITIQGWMVNMGLKGNELLVYALIYGFSQDGASEYRGSINNIAEWLNASRPTVIKTLNSLIEKGYIVKRYGELSNSYRTTDSKETLPPSKETLPPPSKETLHPSKETLLPASKETLPNNNNTINTNNNINSKAHPTREQVREYCSERGNSVDPDKWFDYYEANGWKVGKNPMKDWKAAVRTWERNGFDQKKPQQKAQVQNRFNNYQQSGTDYDALLGRMYS